MSGSENNKLEEAVYTIGDVPLNNNDAAAKQSSWVMLLPDNQSTGSGNNTDPAFVLNSSHEEEPISVDLVADMTTNTKMSHSERVEVAMQCLGLSSLVEEGFNDLPDNRKKALLEKRIGERDALLQEVTNRIRRINEREFALLNIIRGGIGKKIVFVLLFVASGVGAAAYFNPGQIRQKVVKMYSAIAGDSDDPNRALNGVKIRDAKGGFDSVISKRNGAAAIQPPLSHGSQTSTSKLPDFRETDKKGEMLERLNNMLLGSFSGLIEEKLGEKIELKTFEDKMRLYRILQKYWKSRKLDGKNGKVNLSKTAHSKLLYNHMRANLKKEDLNVTKKESEFSADDLN